MRLVGFLQFGCTLISISFAFAITRGSAAQILGNETDRLALLAFKSQISPGSQGVLRSWNTSSHFCKWEGVTCARQHGRVTELNLSSQGLVGSISPYIGNLSYLRSINLSNNVLDGQIPQEIGRLFRLQKLLMNNNSLSGLLPANLSQCSNLLSLQIDANKLMGNIPEDYGYFPKLTDISFYANSLTGEIPDSLGNLSSIEVLSLSYNSLTGSIPSSLFKLRKIQFLGLGVNRLSGMVPSSLFNISSLQVISLASNRLEGSLPRDIGQNLPLLQTLYIGDNQFSGSIPVSLFTNASHFKALSLSANYFSGEIPVEVGSQKNLVILDLDGNFFGSSGKIDDLIFLTSLSNCTKLRLLDVLSNNFGGKLPVSVTNLSTELTHLRLGYNKISGSIPLDIGRLNNLLLLSLSSNTLTGNIPMSIGMLPNLRELELDDNRLSGEIPYSIGNLSSLYYLALSHNTLEGTIVRNFEKCHALQRLYLDHNNLAGIVPKQVFQSSSQLIDVSLSYNSFDGSLPYELGNLKNLGRLDISENKISGQIPNTLGSCLVLEQLHLQGNFFQGDIPSSFGYLKGIESIDLSRNNLSGKIPKALENLPGLKMLNLSFNNFEGEVPKNGIFQNFSAFSVVGNDQLCGGVPEFHLNNCHIQNSEAKTMPLVLKLTFWLVLPSIIVTASILLVFCARKRPSANPKVSEFGDYLPRVSYKELYDATGGFSSEALIGTGSYGSVYKGVLCKDDIPIAVKVFNLMTEGSSKSFTAECEVLRKIRHRNLLKILTICSSVDFKGNDFKALVCELMTNRSLEDWLHPASSGQHLNMSFHQRLNIAIDIAFALEYLHNHCQTTVVHCDLKPSNILLNEDMVASVGDFGLAKFIPENIHISTTTEKATSCSVRGTIGYIPPEYGLGADVSTKGDMYSYGILLLEMFTGKRPTDSMFDNGLTLHSFCEVNLTEQIIEIVDMCMLIEEQPQESLLTAIEVKQSMPDEMMECLISIIRIGVACSSEVIVDRMEIKDVLMKLQSIREVFIGIENHGEFI